MPVAPQGTVLTSIVVTVNTLQYRSASLIGAIEIGFLRQGKTVTLQGSSC
jgi:hypothetical protein